MKGPPPDKFSTPEVGEWGVDQNTSGGAPMPESSKAPWPASPSLRQAVQLLVYVLLAALPPLVLSAGFSPPVAASVGPISAVLIAAFGSALFPRFSTFSRLRRTLLVLAGLGGLIYAMPSLPTPLLAQLPGNATASALLPHVLLCLLCFVWISWLHRREISHPRHNPLGAAELGEDREFLRSLSRYCQALKEHLDRYDNEVNWSDRELTPLQAEVQSDERGRRHGSVAVDLVEAVRRDQKSEVFLVLGDPGSGKSVSLRRLVRTLCEQAPKSGVVPVYVNLREFLPGEEPNTAGLLEFMRTSAFNQTGRDGRAFIDRWYEPFRLGGRLFFVIDSFDELPAVLDSDDKSESHRRISTVFNQFFSQEVQGCRSVLASRLFRSPASFQGARLVIRPFSERQLLSAMETWLAGRGIDSKAYVQRIFRERPQLVPALRNPFSAELISDFALSVAGERLPTSLFAVFDAYVTKRMGGDEDLLLRFGVNTASVRHGAGLIAEFMYRDTRIGLEAVVGDTKAILTSQFGDNAQVIMDVLVDAKIGRLGGKNRQLFSFVHRRFAEFFVVDLMLRKGLPLKVESIPEDSRWRDCLVMYCGVAPREDCVRIARYCWSVTYDHQAALEQGSIAEARAAVHAIRFMADAFPGDSDVLDDSRDAFGQMVLELLQSDDILAAKVGAELIPLVRADVRQRALVLAFRHESAWICETALNGCRHLGHVSKATNEAVRGYLKALPISALLVRFQELNFSLSLSDAFRFQLRYLRLDFAETVLLFVLVLGVCFWKPWLAVPLTLGAFAFAFGFSHSGFTPRRKLDERQIRNIDTAPNAKEQSQVPARRILARFFPADPIKAGLRVSALGSAYLLVVLSVLAKDSLGPRVLQSTYLAHVEELVRVETTFSLYLLPLWIVMLLIVGIGLDGMVSIGRFIASMCSAGFWAQRNWLQTLSENALRLILAVMASAVSVGGVFGFRYLWHHYLPNWLQTGIRALFVGAVSLALFVLIVGLGYRLAREMGNFVRDRRMLARTGVPSVITCTETHKVLRSLRSVRGRHRYLDLLLYRRVKLDGPYLPPSKEYRSDIGTRERLSKLQEQWEGLGL